ncbi:esterase-like activity of phytase family protein [Streptomyces olindensis]|uniref:caspase, EACC1-associated type n=1 Tax=Streptomyces olindensis TaxID=358823 RepID=UPI003695FB9D
MTGPLPDPHASAAVLIGVSSYRHMPKLPTVANNLTRLKEALTDRSIWGLPAARCVTVPDPTKADELIDPVVDAAGAETRDTLIVYYAGHGFLDRHGALRLAMVGSREDRRHTGVLYSELREAILEHSRARRRVIILDCCYSGRAVGDMAGPVTSLRTVAAPGMADSYLLTSAEANAKALAPRKEECTAFTGEFVRVLRQGIPGADGQKAAPYLSLDMIYQQVQDALERRGRPRPQQQDNGRISRLPFVRNLAAPLLSTSPPPPPLWRRYVAAALATAVVPGVTLAADSGRIPSDVCSPRASLLGFSDALDKARFQGQQIHGLSSLALTGPSTALSLSDSAQPVLYTLSLGEPGGKPTPRPAAMTRLTDRGGRAFGPQDFDGEAIALEENRSTVLVASEAGPSVSRFDLTTGEKLADFPVPERFRTAPAGQTTTNSIFESLALTPDGRHLYVGLEAPLSRDGTHQGRNLIRVLRYTGQPGGRYSLDGEIAYETDSGLRLADLVPIGDGERFLALERGFVKGQGNSIQVYETSFAGLPDVTRVPSLAAQPADAFAPKRELVDVGDCPPSGARAKGPQSNPLLDNAEGMALGPRFTTGKHEGRRALYLVSDDNSREDQTTRFYTLAVDLS